jgi:phosphohistidine phosphatase SixA
VHRSLYVPLALVTLAWAPGTPGSGSAGVSPSSAPLAADSVVVFVVRHAEKVEDGSQDPPLTAAGRARTALLARMLSDVALTGAYATDYRRARATAEPAARAAGLEVRLYDPAKPEALAARLRARAGRYLVIGHSNTVPGLVRALGGDPGPDLSEAAYDRLYVVLIGPRGVTTLRLRYGAESGGGTMGVADASGSGPGQEAESDGVKAVTL